MITRFLRFPGGKSRALTLSYDDGVRQDLRLVQIMKQHGLKGTFNINAGLFLPEETEVPEGATSGRLKRSEILTAYPQEICEVACHGYTHPRLELCDPAHAVREVMDDRSALEEMFGRRIQGMAYPYGTYSDQVVDILRNCGILYSRTTVSTELFAMPMDWLRMPATCHHDNPRLMELADLFLNGAPRPTPRLFYVWGHSYEFDKKDNWHVIEQFAEKMGGREDVWYATNMEIYEAWQDFQRLESTADGHLVHNPNVRSVWFMTSTGITYELKPGETVRL